MLQPEELVRKFDENAALYHELMSFKVREVLLVSSQYDAFVLEEDGSLAQRIINEYVGLNLSAPPRLTHASSVENAINLLEKQKFDLVICMPYLGNIDAYSIGRKIKKVQPKIPVILLTPNLQCLEAACLKDSRGIDRTYVWSGDSSLILAIIKNHEDHLNVDKDTSTAMVRVLILIEDSPEYASTLLPLLYREVVEQTQSVLKETFNEEHRLLKMRARPKILFASSYEQAMKLYKRHSQYVFCVMSDTRFPRKDVIDDNAGVRLLKYIRKKNSDMPLLLMSSNSSNKKKAEQIPAIFADKNNPELFAVFSDFFVDHLGFGEFVFRLPNGTEVARASNFSEFNEVINEIPDDSLLYHGQRNHFSNWIMARSEIGMATILSTINRENFKTTLHMRQFLSKSILALRKWRHQGTVANYVRNEFDPEVVEIIKLGQGSMGGKARGIAFLSSLLHNRQDLRQKFDGYPIKIPKTLIISCEIFNEFVEDNKLYYVSGGRDHIIAKRFKEARLPQWLIDSLYDFLKKVDCPLAVRSSSMHEDAQYQPYAGLYRTYMLANRDANFDVRFKQLLDAVKLVYASTYYKNPRSYSKSIGQSRPDSMGVIIQQLIGQHEGALFYPAISGVAQSYNYYPISYMKPSDGIVSMAIGFGKTVVEGENCLRFSPKYPKMLPQFSSVEDTLKNTQRFFYALDMENDSISKAISHKNLKKYEISDVVNGHAINNLCSTYVESEHRIRDVFSEGPKVVTFAQILKYKSFPLTDIISEMLHTCEKGMGGPVEIEFSVDLTNTEHKDKFYLLQVRPLVIGSENDEVVFDGADQENTLCFSEKTLGHGVNSNVHDLVLVKKDSFSPSKTRIIAKEIGKINSHLSSIGKQYILSGPGRWGSADPLLGVPVKWNDISSVKAVIEHVDELLKVDPSQGTHFFQNITSLNIFYFTIQGKKSKDYFDLKILDQLELINETDHLIHYRSSSAFVIKVDGNKMQGIIKLKK